MRLRIIRAVMAGIVLLSIVLVEAAGNVPPQDFFVDPETGTNHAVIVVGSKAASMDVVSASILAAKIGALASPESDETFFFMQSTVHQNINLFLDDSPRAFQNIGSPTVDVPDPRSYWEWEHNAPLTNYPLSLWHFDDVFWGSNDGNFQPWETHEEIQIRFDSDTGQKCAACAYGKDTVIEPAISKDWYLIPGLIYRADNIFAPPAVMVERESEEPVTNPFFSVDLEPYNVFFVPEPWMVVHERLPQFTLFGKTYTVIDAGPVLDINFDTEEPGSLHGTPYIVTGEPHFEAPVYLYLNEPFKFSHYTVILKDVDVDHNKAALDIYCDGELLESWEFVGIVDFVVPPSYGRERERGFSPSAQEEDFPFGDYECRDLNGNGVLDPGEITRIITYDYNKDEVPDYHKWVVGSVDKDVWVDYTWWYYTDDSFGNWLLFNAVDVVIEGVKVFIGAKGTIGIEIKVYWVENKKWWYNKLCSDPWTEKPENYQMFLDVCEMGWDDLDESNQYLYQPPGTGLWPPTGLDKWRNEGYTFVGNGFLDNNDGHTGYEYTLIGPGMYISEQNDLDRDGSMTNDCRIQGSLSNCINLYDIEDPAVWHGPGPMMVELNVYLCDTMCSPDSESGWSIPGFYPKDQPYFTVHVTDPFYECGDEDGIDYVTLTKSRDFTEVEKTNLIMVDTELNFEEWKTSCEYNLILIGGPVANIIVRKLVGGGLSTTDWKTSSGGWEYIVAPYGGCDVLIIAGKDRYATAFAVYSLIEQL